MKYKKRVKINISVTKNTDDNFAYKIIDCG